jgi:hypothetical protein
MVPIQSSSEERLLVSEIIGFPHGHGVVIEPPRQFTTADLVARLQELSNANVQLALRKNADYANSDDPFANFKTSTIVGVPVEKAFLVRMGDKLARIGNLLDRPAEVKDESIGDTLSDLANYALLLRIWLEQR